jgi:hypothetical protein
VYIDAAQPKVTSSTMEIPTSRRRTDQAKIKLLTIVYGSDIEFRDKLALILPGRLPGRCPKPPKAHIVI